MKQRPLLGGDSRLLLCLPLSLLAGQVCLLVAVALGNQHLRRRLLGFASWRREGGAGGGVIASVQPKHSAGSRRGGTRSVQSSQSCFVNTVGQSGISRQGHGVITRGQPGGLRSCRGVEDRVDIRGGVIATACRHVTRDGGGVGVAGAGARLARHGRVGWQVLQGLGRRCLLIRPRTGGNGAELSTGKLRQDTLQVNQGIAEQLEVILCHTVRPSSSGHETELSGLILRSELPYTVVWPPVDFHPPADHHDSLAVELDGAVASEVANIRGGYGREFCRRGRGVGGGGGGEEEGEEEEEEEEEGGGRRRILIYASTMGQQVCRCRQIAA